MNSSSTTAAAAAASSSSSAAPRKANVDSKFTGSPSDSTVSFSLPDGSNSKVVTVVATRGRGAEISEEISYTDTKVIGNGSFGVVYQAKLVHSNEHVAIKKVLQDKRFKVKLVLGLDLRHRRVVFRTENYRLCDD